jgi:hypothetical protein
VLVLFELDIPSISAIVAATGVLVGVVLTVMELRNLTKQRRTDLVTNLYSIYASENFQKEWHTFMTEETNDYNTYRKKYGVEIPPVALFFNELGVLLNEKLIDIRLVDNLFGRVIMYFWKRAEPLLESGRKELNQPRWGWGLEYLHDEMQKRQSKIPEIRR